MRGRQGQSVSLETNKFFAPGVGIVGNLQVDFWKTCWRNDALNNIEHGPFNILG